MCAHVSASSSQADFFNSLRESDVTEDDRFEHSISKSGGTPRHRSYTKSGGSYTTNTDTTSTGTWVSADDDTGWTICQMEYDFSTKALKTRFRNLGTGHNTGQEDATVVTPPTEAMEYVVAGLRNLGGSQTLLAQVWVGTANDSWPEGKLNGFG